MSRQPVARQSARAVRHEIAGPDELLPADELLSVVLGSTGLSVDPLPHGDPLLAGAYAVLDRELAHIWYDASLPPSTRRFSLAHELAHWFLHDSQGPCGEEEIDAGALEEGSGFPFGEAYVQGYSRAQRRETEANAFASELLAPRRAVRTAFDRGMLPREIADRIGIAESTVLGQLVESLLPEPTEPDPEPPTAESSLSRLDSSQRVAATVEHGPTLVVAGPGTGKTRTLVARIEFLLQQGMPAHQILALTFSNRAANEMRQRLAETTPDAAQKIWIGTFHAFGLEILKRFGTRIGLPSASRILDPLDAITLMEHHLAEMELEEYEYLHDPILPLRDLLGAISRAKDELKSPSDYADHASRLEEADGEEQARKAIEVARVYARWQDVLQREGLLDFGDLLYRSVALLQDCPDVREHLQHEYPHILVDEYQDVNRASAVLVRELAGDGEGLWLVGDLRQAIYRFRGAAPSNLSAFEEDYPGGRRITLDVNYRSRETLVHLFSDVARQIGQPVERGWSARRADGGRQTMDAGEYTDLPPIIFGEADDERAQADHIASYVRQFVEHGYSYSDQAVLCRTNRQAERLGELLEERSLPAVQSESLRELLVRPEVKDLLALMSLVSEGGSASMLALHRVARFPEYQISDAEVQRIRETVTGPERPSLLSLLASSPEEGARRLHAHLSPIAFADSGSGQAGYVFLARYLFGSAKYLSATGGGRPAAEDRTSRVELRRRRSIYRLLGLARSFQPPDGEEGKRAFLAHVRRLLATGEGGRTADIQAQAESGVRLVTAHGAKGLEFPVVFVPNLCEGMFPPRSRSGMVRLPPGLVAGDSTERQEADEEARLFFVALTRARDQLILSFPHSVMTANRKNSSARSLRPSSLLSLVREPLAAAGACVERWSSLASAPEEHPSSVVDRPSLVRRPPSEPVPLAEVETYLRCPRQHYYRYVQQMPEPETDRGYRSFARAARSLVQWRRGATALEAADARLEEIWTASGLADHAHAPMFRRKLEAIRDRLESLDSDQPQEWQAELESGSISLRPDGESPGVVERHHLGRESDSHRTAALLSLYRLAARQRGIEDVRVINRYLGSGETQVSPANPRYEPGRIAKYEAVLRGIQSDDFDPEPAEPNECNRCPFFLVCPL